jgi:hypothetical protein
MRKYVAHCNVCQRAKHPNREYEIEKLSHLPTTPGELMTLDLYGPIPRGRGGVKYLLACLKVFSKRVALHPLKHPPSGAVLTNSERIIFRKSCNRRQYCRITNHNSQALRGGMQLQNWASNPSSLQFDTRRAILQSALCVNSGNISGSTAIRLIRNGQNYCHV